MKTELRAASAAAQAGRFEEAIARYRQILASEPEEPEATHFLGLCLAQSGRGDEGMRLIRRSLALAPHNALFRQNFGFMLAQAGALEEAHRQFDAILAREPGNATAHNYLGMVRQRLGRLDEAIASYGEALRLKPRDAASANNLGYCLLEQGAVEEARKWLEISIAADPRAAMTHNNLGNVLRTTGELALAVQCYRRALALAPGLADAHHNLAMTLRDLGERQGALQAARAAVHCAGAPAGAWQLFAELVSTSRFGAWNGELARDCEELLSRTEVEVESCAEAILSLARHVPRGRLLLLLLEHAIVADESFEREMSAERRKLLLAGGGELERICALAQQCFLNEYVWPELADETAALERLASAPRTPLELATLAMYRPLRGHAKPQGAGEAFERLWRRVVEEPAIESSLDVPMLTAIEDGVSAKVRSQYEAYPYPRWHRAPATAPFLLPRMLRSLFPEVDPARLAAPEAPHILIAGCGTGRHAAITAQLQPHGRLLAVDLSRASLAYAMRRCRALGLSNVRFAQADILRLGTLAERFDLIECSGVLHHMQDPAAGWRVLVSLLKPGGFMKLGLYSELARRHIVAAREKVKGLEVRAARARIFALPPDDPAREVTRLRDFYSASGARDLILHVQEHRFSIPQLASALGGLGLEFLGFELSGRRMALDLEQWDAYETANPDTFASMYQFWVRKPGSV